MNKIDQRLLLFGVFTSLFLLVISVMYYRTNSESWLIIMMLSPAISVILTRFITREGLKDTYLKPRFKENWHYYIVAYLGIPAVAFFGAIIYFLLFPNQLDVLDSKFAIDGHLSSISEYLNQFLKIFPLALFFNPIFNLVQCFGEELAWRGYLLPKLSQKFSVLKATMITGVVWGIWHAPVIFKGFNYGTEHPILGILLMIFYCVVLSIIFSYLFFKTKSIWISVVAHAAINGLDLVKPSYLFMSETANPFIGPDLIGLIGGSGFVIISVFCYLKMKKEQNTLNLSF